MICGRKIRFYGHGLLGLRIYILNIRMLYLMGCRWQVYAVKPMLDSCKQKGAAGYARF